MALERFEVEASVNMLEEITSVVAAPSPDSIAGRVLLKATTDDNAGVPSVEPLLTERLSDSDVVSCGNDEEDLLHTLDVTDHEVVASEEGPVLIRADIDLGIVDCAIKVA